MALPTIEPPRVALRLTPQARVDATNGAVRVVAHGPSTRSLPEGRSPGR